MNQAVFYDRDGVINKPLLIKGQAFSPKSAAQFEFNQGVKEFLNQARNDGFLNIVVTNQPDIARGLMSSNDLEEIHELIRTELPIDDIMVCPHDNADNCKCRKPKAGMLLNAAESWKIDLHNSYMIGDQSKDIEAGRNAGCTTILMDYPYNKNVIADFRIQNLSQARKILFESEGIPSL